MGGRVATLLAAQDFACDGLLLFAYPLHPDGKPEKLRDAHLPTIRVRAPWRMHWLDGAGHAFHDIPEAEIRDWLAALER